MPCLPARVTARAPARIAARIATRFSSRAPARHRGPARWVWIFALLAGLMTATACGREAPPPGAGEVLSAMEAAMEATAQPLPEGVTYLRSALQTEGDGTRVLTDTLFSALYGEAARGLLAAEGTSAQDGGGAAVNDAAIFLSMAPYPCELAVFRCSDVRTAATVAGLCRGRLDAVARGYGESEWREVAASGLVAVEGSYVLLVVAEDPEAVLAAAAGVIP